MRAVFEYGAKGGKRSSICSFADLTEAVGCAALTQYDTTVRIIEIRDSHEAKANLQAQYDDAVDRREEANQDIAELRQRLDKLEVGKLRAIVQPNMVEIF